MHHCWSEEIYADKEARMKICKIYAGFLAILKFSAAPIEVRTRQWGAWPEKETRVNSALPVRCVKIQWVLTNEPWNSRHFQRRSEHIFLRGEAISLPSIYGGDIAIRPTPRARCIRLYFPLSTILVTPLETAPRVEANSIDNNML